MAGSAQREPELLWLEYRGRQSMVPEIQAKEYKLSVRCLHQDHTTIMLPPSCSMT